MDDDFLHEALVGSLIGVLSGVVGVLLYMSVYGLVFCVR